MEKAQRHGGGERRETARAWLHGVRAPLLLVTLQQSKQMWPSFIIKDVQNNYPDLELPVSYYLIKTTLAGAE